MKLNLRQAEIMVLPFALAMALGLPGPSQNSTVKAQQRSRVATQTVPLGPLPNVTQATNWPLHNLDLGNSRYASMKHIDASNVHRLKQRWTFEMPSGENIAAQTPLVIDGIMYFNSGSKLYAINAMTGTPIWNLQLGTEFPGGGRGPAYGDGRIYAFGRSVIYAADAKTGKLSESFGERGLLRVVNKALEFKYPGKYPATLDPTSIGYSMTNPPTFFNGTLYLGLPFSDSLLPGGLVVAIDGVTGAIRWVFNTVPQGPQDDGWELAKDTWSGPNRYGAGIWTPPAIDPELGLIYVNTGNATPNYDGSSRKGINLFTNSLVALNLVTGKLVWHFQAIHHDLWDWDLVNGPLLFDLKLGDRTVRGIGTLPKTCYAFFLNRETGQPINPVVETPVPTKSDVPGEEVWPTQPMPYTARGVPQQPFCSTYPIVTDPELAARVRPSFHPYQVNEFVITAPGNTGGPNYGGSSFSPRTGLFYVTGQNDAWSIKINLVGDTLKPGPGNKGHFAMIAENGKTGVAPTTTIAAYEPGTGEVKWRTDVSAPTRTGNLVTAGDVVFQGVGNMLYAFDAKSGRELFSASTKAIRASPLTYEVNGTQYVAIVATNTVFAFALPEDVVR